MYCCTNSIYPKIYTISPTVQTPKNKIVRSKGKKKDRLHDEIDPTLVLVVLPSAPLRPPVGVPVSALSVLLTQPDLSLNGYHTQMTLIARRICSLPSRGASYLIPVPVRLPNATHALYLVVYGDDEWRRRDKEAHLQTLSYTSRYFPTARRIDPRSPICRGPFHSALH